MREKTSGNKLWTRDFTIITLGSVVSMFGNAMSGFAVSLMVLDYSDSTLLYAIYLAMFTIPQIVMPILSGAILDRFSRRKTIYTLDFISSGLFVVAASLLYSGRFYFPVFAFYCFVLGSIQSVYMVAYQSYYPLLISEGNFSRAYSIAATLETLTAVMIPVSTWLYHLIGIAPLLAFNAVCFFIAAVMETQLKGEEAYIEKQKASAGPDEVTHGRRMLMDIREGFRYLTSEKGLFAVAAFFAFMAMSGGVSQVITLPYFKQHFPNGENDYILVWGMLVIGRALGGLFYYRHKIPARRKYAMALGAYLLIELIEGYYLFLPSRFLMQVVCFISGVLGVTTYTIRVSATQSYVPDEMKGRFNGAFNMLNTLGALAGEGIAGVLSVSLPQRGILAGTMTVTMVAALVLIGGGHREVARIYNRES